MGDVYRTGGAPFVDQQIEQLRSTLRFRGERER